MDLDNLSQNSHENKNKHKYQGTLITFEGIDGTGKTTQCERLIKALSCSPSETVFLREPGATRLGERIRELVLSSHDIQIDAKSELLLYEAARAQLIEETIQPALLRGAYVICDRFYDSTTAYQGFGRGLGLEFALSANQLACGDIVPHKTLYFELDPLIALKRATVTGADRIEQTGIDFMYKVQEGYQNLALLEPDRFITIDASKSKDEVWNQVKAALSDCIDFSFDCSE